MKLIVIFWIIRWLESEYGYTQAYIAESELYQTLSPRLRTANAGVETIANYAVFDINPDYMGVVHTKQT